MLCYNTTNNLMKGVMELAEKQSIELSAKETALLLAVLKQADGMAMADGLDNPIAKLHDKIYKQLKTK